MRTLISLACISLLSLLSACDAPNDGYYDANGNWIPNNPYNEKIHSHSPLPGGTSDNHANYDDNHPVTTTTTVTTYTYDRAGYYNHDGSYIGTDSNLAVPQNMFPPRGMCRVWFTEREIMNQPPIESCTGIQSRVPTGAYVIYGG